MIIKRTLGLLRGIAASADHKSQSRRNGVPLDRNLLRSLRQKPIAKQVPRKIARLIKSMWGKKCEEHNETLTRTHLSEAHGIVIDSLALIRASQGSCFTTKQLKALCWSAIMKVELLSVKNPERRPIRQRNR